MPTINIPHYVFTPDALVFHSVPMPGRGGGRPEDRAPRRRGGAKGERLPREGPLAVVLDRNNGIILKHGPREAVEAWVSEAWWQRLPYVANVVTMHFPTTELGIATLNALLRTAFLSGRMLWGAGPGEMPKRD